MNSSNDFAKVNKKALEKVEGLKPNFSLFDNGKDFNELFYSGETFVQVFYYDKTNGKYDGQTQINIQKEKEQELIESVNTYNEKLEEAQTAVLDEMGISEYSRRNYFYFNRVGDDIGIAHLHTYVRNQKEEMEEAKRAAERETSDADADNGPYGGAFRDYMDFIRYKEGPGFLKD